MDKPLIDFAIVTALEIEREAVCKAFRMSDRDRIRVESRTYWRNSLKLKNGEFYTIIVAQSADMAAVDAATLTSDLIHHWQPGAILLVGIAAGVNPEIQHLGDLVIGSNIYYYERSKITPDGQTLEPYMLKADPALWNRAQTVAKWKTPIPEPRPDQTKGRPQIHYGVIASGEKVIADAVARNELVEEHRKIVAIEMEGYGFGSAAQQSFQQIRPLVIKAICDWADENKNKEWQIYAAAVAAGFTKHFLHDRPLDPRNPPAVKPKAQKEPLEPHYGEIINAFWDGSIVPFLGSGINLYNRAPVSNEQLEAFYDRILYDSSSTSADALMEYPLSEIELAPLLSKELQRSPQFNNYPDQDLLRRLIGIPCLFCHVDPMNRPDQCPIRGDNTDWNCPLAIEQRLTVAKMNLRFIAQYFKLMRSPTALYSAIQRFFKYAKPNAIHYFFANLPKQLARSSGNLPYQLIVTTNYDNCLEAAFDLAGQPYNIVFYDAEGNDRGRFKYRLYQQNRVTVIEHPETYLEELSVGKVPVILKLYGSLEGDFVITEDQHLDYLSNEVLSFSKKRVPASLLSILKESSILFMGYSPNDYDLQFLHPRWEQRDLGGHSWFIHQSQPGSIDQKLWEKRGVTPIDRSLSTCLTELEKGIDKIAEETRKYAGYR